MHICVFSFYFVVHHLIFVYLSAPKIVYRQPFDLKKQFFLRSLLYAVKDNEKKEENRLLEIFWAFLEDLEGP